jgi:CRP-like cAMP-binding protein
MAEANALTDRQREYREVYLRSDHWGETRAAALERAEHRCQACNGQNTLDVHHRTYERIGHELAADLTVLCRACHEAIHGTPDDDEALDDHFKAIAEGRRQVLLILIAIRPRTRGDLDRQVCWSRSIVSSALSRLEKRGLIEQNGKRWVCTKEGEQWGHDLLCRPEPAYWRLPEDPDRLTTKAAARSTYR